MITGIHPVLYIFDLILGIIIMAFLLWMVGELIGIENSEFVNCFVAVVIITVLRIVVFLILPLGTLTLISVSIVLIISAFVVAKVLDCPYGHAFMAVVLMYIAYIGISFILPCGFI